MEEVFLWRGSPEQRALRSQLARSGQFAYFDKQLGHPDWTNKTVLDFGGNAGNLLADPACVIRPENYYCIDVLKEAVEEGSRQFPEANWIHYDRYNCSFNPAGVPNLQIPRIGIDFDMILAYSVFTHMAREDMHDLVDQLWTQLAPGGVLAFTFIDPHFRSWPLTYKGNNLQWRLEKLHENNHGVDMDSLLERSRDASWCALVDENLYVNSNGVWNNESRTCITYHIYYTVEFLQREFPCATIRAPVNNEMQHCCIIHTAT